MPSLTIRVPCLVQMCQYLAHAPSFRQVPRTIACLRALLELFACLPESQQYCCRCTYAQNRWCLLGRGWPSRCSVARRRCSCAPGLMLINVQPASVHMHFRLQVSLRLCQLAATFVVCTFSYKTLSCAMHSVHMARCNLCQTLNGLGLPPQDCSCSNCYRRLAEGCWVSAEEPRYRL